MNRFGNSFLRLALMVLIVMLFAVPVIAQDEGFATVTPDAAPVEAPAAPVVSPVVVAVDTDPAPEERDWYDFAVIVLMGFGVIGSLSLAYFAVTGLKDSYPPGTAASWEKMWNALNDQAEKSDTPIDNLALSIAGPLAEAIIAQLRLMEVPKPPAPPPPAETAAERL